MKRVLILLLMSLVAGCATATSLESRLDPDVSMDNLQTFRILPNHYSSSTAPLSVAAAKRDIERAIQDHLVKKCYRRLISGKAPADFEVEYVMYVTERMQEGVHDRYVFSDRVRLLGGAESLLDDPIREGTLHIHLLKNGEPFYEAIASDVIPRESPWTSGFVQRCRACCRMFRRPAVVLRAEPTGKGEGDIRVVFPMRYMKT